MKKVLAILLVGLFVLNLVSCAEYTDNESPQENMESIEPEEKNETQENNTTDELEEQVVDSEKTKVDLFIADYNSKAIAKITNVTDINITDKESGHYRTEFRLTAYKDSIAKTGNIGDVVIDIINYGYSKDSIRVYADNVSLEQAKEIVLYASGVLDEELTDEDIQAAIKELDERGEVNGYYYGDIGLMYIGGDLMLKME